MTIREQAEQLVARLAGVGVVLDMRDNFTVSKHLAIRASEAALRDCAAATWKASHDECATICMNHLNTYSPPNSNNDAVLRLTELIVSALAAKAREVGDG